jgi:hypothetical protein
MSVPEIIDSTLPPTFKGLLPALRQQPALGDTRWQRVLRLLAAGGVRAGFEPNAAQEAQPSLESFVAGLSSNSSKSSESAAERKRHLRLGRPGSASGREGFATINKALNRLCGPEPFARLVDSPYDGSPLTALALIFPVAQRLSESGTIPLASERREVLLSLGLDGDVLDWSNENLVTVCRAAGVPPTFEGLCWIDNQDLLSCVIISGLGLEDTKTAQLCRDAGADRKRIAAIARLIADRRAPQPDPWVTHMVMNEQIPLGGLAIRYVRLTA